MARSPPSSAPETSSRSPGPPPGSRCWCPGSGSPRPLRRPPARSPPVTPSPAPCSSRHLPRRAAAAATATHRVTTTATMPPRATVTTPRPARRRLPAPTLTGRRPGWRNGSEPATDAAASPAAPSPPCSATSTTSDRGRPAEPPTTTCSACAGATTASSNDAVGGSPSAPAVSTSRARYVIPDGPHTELEFRLEHLAATGPPRTGRRHPYPPTPSWRDDHGIRHVPELTPAAVVVVLDHTTTPCRRLRRGGRHAFPDEPPF